MQSFYQPAEWQPADESYITCIITCHMSETESSLSAFKQMGHADEGWWMENLRYRFMEIPFK